MFPRKGPQPIVGNSFYPVAPSEWGPVKSVKTKGQNAGNYFSSKFLPDFMNTICSKKLFVCKPTNYKTGTS